jgi:hypothetical protein
MSTICLISFTSRRRQELVSGAKQPLLQLRKRDSEWVVPPAGTPGQLAGRKNSGRCALTELRRVPKRENC